MTMRFQARTPSIYCEACANAIKRSLGRMTGVQSVDVDMESKRVSVLYENSQVDESALRERLALAGYPAE